MPVRDRLWPRQLRPFNNSNAPRLNSGKKHLSSPVAGQMTRDWGRRVDVLERTSAESTEVFMEMVVMTLMINDYNNDNIPR